MANPLELQSSVDNIPVSDTNHILTGVSDDNKLDDMGDDVEISADPKDRMPLVQRLSYSVGHVLNDLCAAMWFSYLLVYYHSVINFSNQLAGYVVLLGQVADAICTPLIGYESDQTKGFGRYGRRKSWHLVGCVCVAMTFPFLFIDCITCSNASNWAKFVYFAPFVVIFQFGWATTQVSHLALIPELTSCESERVELNARRYAFTVLSNISVYGIAWFLFSSVGSDQLGEEDKAGFMRLALIVVGIGVVFMLLFHSLTREPPPYDRHTEQNASNDPSVQRRDMTWSDWFKEYQFYQIGLLYMCTRLVINIQQIYLPMYLLQTLQMTKTFIAILPLVVYASGFLTALAMKPVNRYLGRKITYALGSCLMIGASVIFYILNPSTDLYVFAPSVLTGIGGSIMLITSLSLTADLIGNNTSSGAFVYGAMSFTDKLSNGIAVLILQNIHPCKTTACCPACQSFYRYTMVFVPGGVAVLSLLVICSLIPVKVGQLSRRNLMIDHTVNEQSEPSTVHVYDEEEEEDRHSDAAYNTREAFPVPHAPEIDNKLPSEYNSHDNLTSQWT